MVEPEWGHSCRDSDEESIPEVSSVNDSDFCVQSESNFNEEEVISTNSEIMATGVVATCQCGRYECDCDCVDSSQDMTRVSNSDKSVDKSVDRTVVVPKTETFIPFKIEIEDKIMIHKVAVLNDKTSDNKNNIINSNSIERNVVSLPVKRINEQNLRTNNKKIVKQNDFDDDIVIISEVSADSRPQSGQKRLSEPDIIERYLTPNLETNPSTKRKFCEKRLRSHSRNNSEEIIVKKLK